MGSGEELRGRIKWLIEAMDVDELRVLELIARRITFGKREYGTLELETDGRNWRQERSEELADDDVYHACDELTGGTTTATDTYHACDRLKDLLREEDAEEELLAKAAS